ncbi:MAG: hypothetical protein IAI49_06480 [Candidatus Eremiobacteraeota bacterium]|nr:hypothetical protein [Candidatus Eremiobacteraeota bacterium]
MLCEISARPEVKLDLEASATTILHRLRAQGLVPESSTVVSQWTAAMTHGYPVPFIGRDALLQDINASLWARGILSRGRFGGWKYEVSNQDHTFMQGVEAIDFLLADRAETTYCLPQAVN